MLYTRGLYWVLIALSSLVCSLNISGCSGGGGDTGGGTTPATSPSTPPSVPVSFTSSDLMGSWTGSASNSTNTIPLTLQVDSTGRVSGSGVSTTWSIDNSGRVTGDSRGAFSFVSGTQLIVALGAWTLQLSTDKRNLSGTFDVSISNLHNMSVTLTQAGSNSRALASEDMWRGAWTSDVFPERGGVTNASLARTGNSLTGVMTLTGSSCFATGDFVGIVSEKHLMATVHFSPEDSLDLGGDLDAESEVIVGEYQLRGETCDEDHGSFTLMPSASR